MRAIAIREVMNVNKTLRLGLLGLLVSVATTLACGTAGSPAQPGDAYVGRATDAEHFATFEEAIRSADEIALVSVVGSAPGRTVTVSNVSLPFTNVSMNVLVSVRGTTSGKTIIVEQTGGPILNGALVTDNDPPYRVGTTHVLLLRSIPVGFRIVNGSVGRYEVVGGLIRPNDHARLANPFVGKGIAEFMTWARQLR